MDCFGVWGFVRRVGDLVVHMLGALITAWLTVNGADIISSHAAIRAGATERWLPAQPILRDALIGSQAAGTAIVLARLHSSHPKLAIGLLIGLTASRTIIVVHNLRVIHQQHQGGY